MIKKLIDLKKEQRHSDCEQLSPEAVTPSWFACPFRTRSLNQGPTDNTDLEDPEAETHHKVLI